MRNTKMFAIELGRNLREFREATGLIRATVAHHTGIHVNTLSNMELGNYVCGVDTLKILCDFYELDLNLVVPSGKIYKESEVRK